MTSEPLKHAGGVDLLNLVFSCNLFLMLYQNTLVILYDLWGLHKYKRCLYLIYLSVDMLFQILIIKVWNINYKCLTLNHT